MTSSIENLMRTLRSVWHISACWCAIAFVTTAAATSALAQQQTARGPRKIDQYPERVMDDHVFLSPAFMPTPFLATHFEFQQGVTQVSIDDFPITENASLDVELLGLRERIEAGVRFADRFELFGFATGEVLSGSSGRSVIAAGSSFLYAAGLGGRFRLFRSNPSGTQISARVQGMAGRGGLLDLLRLADALADDPNPELQTILDRRLGELVLGDTSRQEVAGQLLAAQSLGKNFDLQGGLGVNYTRFSVELYDAQANREFERTLDSVGPVASVAFGAKLTPLLPLGFMLEYLVQSDRHVLAGAEDATWTNPSHLVGLGIHTVDPNFQVGLTFARLMNVEQVSTVDPFTGRRLTSDTPVVHYAQLGMTMSW
jgi:hypothetical protein